jgi:hypothetical protein
VDWFFTLLLVIMEVAATGYAMVVGYRLYVRQR